MESCESIQFGMLRRPIPKSLMPRGLAVAYSALSTRERQAPGYEVTYSALSEKGGAPGYEVTYSALSVSGQNKVKKRISGCIQRPIHKREASPGYEVTYSALSTSGQNRIMLSPTTEAFPNKDMLPPTVSQETSLS